MGSGLPLVLLLPQALVTILPGTLLRFLWVGNSLQVTTSACTEHCSSHPCLRPHGCALTLQIRSGKGIVSLF